MVNLSCNSKDKFLNVFARGHLSPDYHKVQASCKRSVTSRVTLSRPLMLRFDWLRERRRRWKCSVTLLADFSTFSFCTSLQLWVLYFLWALFFLCCGCGRVGSVGSTIDWLCLGYFSRRWANQVIFFQQMFLTNSCLEKRLDSIHNHQSRVRFNL